MSGTLRLGHIDGLSKIILNGVASSKDFYVNGDSEISGNLLVASLDSSGYIKGSNIQSNTFNALNTNDILFQSNSDTYIQYDVSESKIVASKIIQPGGNLKTQEIDTIAPLDLIIRRNNVSMIELQDNLTVLKTKTKTQWFLWQANCLHHPGEAMPRHTSSSSCWPLHVAVARASHKLKLRCSKAKTMTSTMNYEKKYNSKSQAESHLHFGLMICWLQFILWETLLGFLRHVSMQNSNSGEVLALSQVIPNLSSRRALQTSNLAPRQHGRRTSCRDKAAEPVDHGVAWTLEKLVKFKRYRMGCPAPTEAAHTHTTSGKGDKKALIRAILITVCTYFPCHTRFEACLGQDPHIEQGPVILSHQKGSFHRTPTSGSNWID